jgi:hypothetical protein
MSTLIAIPAAGLHAPSVPAPSNRRLAWGLLVSLLLHALLLSLQFGVPGLRPGAGRPLSVVLAPSRVPSAVAPTPPPVATPAPVGPPVPVVPSVTATPPVPATPAPSAAAPVPAPHRGFMLRDPAPALPAPPVPKPAPPVRRTLRRRSRPRVQPPKASLHTEVIARQMSEDPSFVLPQPELPAIADVPEGPAERQDSVPAAQLAQQADEEAAVLARADAERELAQQRAAEEEAKRVAEQQLAQQQMAERQRLAEQARDQQLAEQRRAEDAERQQLLEQQRGQQLAEQRRTEELARQQVAEQQRARQLAEQRRTDELARQQLAEQQRTQQLAEQRRAEEAARQQLAEQQRTQQLAEQRRAEETARQQLTEQQRAQQLAEQRHAEEAARQQLAEQQRAQQLAEQRRAEEAARQQLAEQQRAQQLADQRQAEERARQDAARQQTEELARQRAADADAARRLARQDEASGQPAVESGGGQARAERGVRSGQGGGIGAGAGGAGSPSLPGKDFGSRARELLRGIDIAKAVPPAMRAAEQAQQAVRRAFADAARHDVPLRMYIDSVRQKIERNAIVSEAQLSSQAVHTDPVVSIAIRSDGSIDDVTILRSSGRPDIDEIVRRVVRLNARYAAFPANVAANYDVIELRRIWTFAGVLRLVEEVR